MAKRRHYAPRMHEQYAGREETKRTMARDGAMIHEDHSAPALLPMGVISKDWPRAHGYYQGAIDDLFTGVQRQLKEDQTDYRRENTPKKY